MKTKIFLTTLIIFCSIQNSFSQYTQEWVARYNSPGNYNDEATNLVVDNSGNVFVTGQSQSHYLTVKYNSSGQEIWTQIYNGAYPLSFDMPDDMVIDQSGDVYITGRARATGWYHDYVTVKYNSVGSQIWVGEYNSPYDDLDAATSMVLDKNGKLYVTGSSYIYDSNYNVSYNTIKYDSEGSVEWISRFFENFLIAIGPYVPPADIAIDSSGNIIIACSHGIKGDKDFKHAVIKYDSAGQQLWKRDLPSRRDMCKLTTDKSGNIYFAGNDYDTISTVKFDPMGDILWVRKNKGLNIINIEVDTFRNVYIAGTSDPSGYLTVKYDSNGNLMWSSIDSIGYSLSSMTIDNNGNVYETGSTNNYTDYYTIKYNTNGVRVWSHLYNGPGNSYDRANDIAIDNSGNIYVTGISSGVGSSGDYATIKYSVITNSNYITSTVPENFILYQNYPNPFNPITKINYSLPNTEFTVLKVYDILGNEIASLVNEKQNAGSYSVEFDAGNYPSGIYYYKLEAGNFSEVRKMILIK